MLVKGVLSNYLNFLVKSPTDSNKARWSVAPWWNEFLGNGCMISFLKLI